jgi:CHASE2 domain-containing sensor protein
MATIAVAIIAVFNPFGISDWTDNHTRDVWQEIYAHQYEPKAAGRQRDARNAITVVTIDDAARDAIASRHPMNSMDIAQIIEDIVEAPGRGAAPRALFVDLLLGEGAPHDKSMNDLIEWTDAQKETCLTGGRDEQKSAFQCLLIKVGELTRYDRWKDIENCRTSTLAKVLCIENAGGMPVFFADASPGLVDGSHPPTDSLSAAGFAALNRVAATTPVRVDGRHYPLIARYMGPEGVSGFSLYPAAALYAAYCQREACAPSPTTADERSWSKAFGSPIDVVWALGRPSPFTKMRDRLEGAEHGTCRPAQPGLWAAVKHFMRKIAGGIHPVEKETDWCVYTNTILYSGLAQGMVPADARRALGGKIVLLGGQLSDNNDRVPASLYGSLPGVYYHAMALDNLIQRGAQYPKVAVPVTPWLDVTWTEVASEVAIFLTTFAIALLTGWVAMREAADPAPSFSGRSVRRLGLLLTVVAAILGMLFLMSLVGENLIPENFNIAAISVVCLIALYDLTVEVTEPIWAGLWTRANHRVAGTSTAAAEGPAPDLDKQP